MAKPNRWSQHLAALIDPSQQASSQEWAVLDFTQRWKLAEVLGALDAYGLKGKPLKRATSRHIAQRAALVERGAFMLVHVGDELPLLLDRLRSPLLVGQTVQLATEAWPGLLRMLKTQLNNEAFRWISVSAR